MLQLQLKEVYRENTLNNHVCLSRNEPGHCIYSLRDGTRMVAVNKILTPGCREYADPERVCNNRIMDYKFSLIRRGAKFRARLWRKLNQRTPAENVEDRL